VLSISPPKRREGNFVIEGYGGGAIDPKTFKKMIESASCPKV
jgi:hypothetical protein